MEKLLTIIIPVYNTEKYILRCLKSIEHEEVNVVIVDDGSTDKSPMILDEYAKSHDNVLVVHTVNQGAATARQVGLNYVNTPYFSFVDSDDTVRITNYMNLVHAMKERGYSVSNGRLVVYLPGLMIPFGSRKWSKADIDFEQDKLEFSNTTCSLLDKIFSRDMIELFQEPSKQVVYEDLEFVYYALAKKRFMLHSNDLIYDYRMRGLANNSTSAIGLDSRKVDGISGLLGAITSMKGKFRDSGLLGDYQDELDAIAIKLIYQRIYNVLSSADIENKKEMAELVFQILSAYVPDWQRNKYFLACFKNSELNDYLFYIVTEVLAKIYKVSINEPGENYKTLLDCYGQKLVLKKSSK